MVGDSHFPYWKCLKPLASSLGLIIVLRRISDYV